MVYKREYQYNVFIKLKTESNGIQTENHISRLDLLCNSKINATSYIVCR